MINFSELQVGDYVIAEYEGTMWEGEVMNLNNDEKQMCIQTEVQEFLLRAGTCCFLSC